MAEARREPTIVSVEDYLAAEEESEVRREFVNGVLYAMVGARDRHNLIVGNLHARLWNELRHGCDVFSTDMKLRVRLGRDELFYYPDIMVSFSPTDREPYWREEPVLVAEVLSPSTERVDRTEKFNSYTQILSLQEYLLIAQDRVEIEIVRRATEWRRETATSGEIRLDSVAQTISIIDLYRRTDLAD